MTDTVCFVCYFEAENCYKKTNEVSKVHNFNASSLPVH